MAEQSPKPSEESPVSPTIQLKNVCTRNKTPDSVHIREIYQELGYLTPIPVLSPEETKEILYNFNAWANTLPDKRVTGNYRFKPHLHLPFISRLIHHPTIVNLVANVLNTPNLLLWSSDFNIKEPKSDGYFALHQDGTYTGLNPPYLGVTVWLALTDPVDDVHGCMTYIAESHKLGQFTHVEYNTEEKEEKNDTKIENREIDNHKNNMLNRKQRVILKNDDFCTKAVLASLRGGEASLHHFHLLHRSGPNRGNQPRIGLAMRYIAAEVRQIGKIKEMVTLVKGKMEHDGFDLEPVLPHGKDIDTGEMKIYIERGKKAHKEAMQRESLNYFDGSINQVYL